MQRHSKKIAILALISSLFVGASLVAQSNNKDNATTELKPFRVGATPVPAAEILEFAKPLLAKKGIKLIVQSFTDYITPDIALEEGSLDASLHQHKPFMDKMNKDRKLHLVSIAPIYIIPLGFYSRKYKTLDSIPNGAIIALPNDPSNYSRALILLHDNKIITLRDGSNLDSKEFDIIKNPKNFKFKPIEAASIPRVLDGVDAAVINGNYALQAKMSIKEAFFYENEKSQYVNVLVSRENNKDSKELKILQEVLESKDISAFILKKYGGEIPPIHHNKPQK